MSEYKRLKIILLYYDVRGIRKDKLEAIIKKFVKYYCETTNAKTKWKQPLITYAKDKRLYSIKDIVSPSHALPNDLLPEAKTVVAYFIPFDDEIVKSNIEGRECSKIWAQAYIIKAVNSFMGIKRIKYLVQLR